MSYSATNWVDGTIPVNASNLNKLEGGVADLSEQIDGLIVPFSGARNAACYTDFVYTGVSFEVPADCIFVVNVQAWWSNSSAVAVGIGTNDTSWNAAGALAYATIPANRSSGSANATLCYDSSENTTFYIWAQYASESTNRLRWRGFYIKT